MKAQVLSLSDAGRDRLLKKLAMNGLEGSDLWRLSRFYEMRNEKGNIRVRKPKSTHQKANVVDFDSVVYSIETEGLHSMVLEDDSPFGNEVAEAYHRDMLEQHGHLSPNAYYIPIVALIAADRYGDALRFLRKAEMFCPPNREFAFFNLKAYMSLCAKYLNVAGVAKELISRTESLAKQALNQYPRYLDLLGTASTFFFCFADKPKIAEAVYASYLEQSVSPSGVNQAMQAYLSLDSHRNNFWGLLSDELLERARERMYTAASHLAACSALPSDSGEVNAFLNGIRRMTKSELSPVIVKEGLLDSNSLTLEACMDSFISSIYTVACPVCDWRAAAAMPHFAEIIYACGHSDPRRLFYVAEYLRFNDMPHFAYDVLMEAFMLAPDDLSVNTAILASCSQLLSPDYSELLSSDESIEYKIQGMSSAKRVLKNALGSETWCADNVNREPAFDMAAQFFASVTEKGDRIPRWAYPRMLHQLLAEPQKDPWVLANLYHNAQHYIPAAELRDIGSDISGICFEYMAENNREARRIKHHKRFVDGYRHGNKDIVQFLKMIYKSSKSEV